MGIVDEAAASAVKAGMDMFAYSIGDSMINLNGNGTVVNRQETPNLILSMLSYTVDPFSMDFVKNWWGTSLVFFVMVAILYICVGGGFALLSTHSPELAQRISWIDGSSHSNFNIKQWFSNVVLAMVFPLFTYFGLYVILQMSYVITAMLSQAALDALPLTPSNIIVYLFMAATYLFLSILMSIRNIVIVVFCAGGLMLAALYLIPALQGLIKNVFMYFLLLVFMQPILVFVAAVGVIFITSLPPALMPLRSSLLLALMILLFLISMVLVFGYGTISRMIGIAGKAAL